MQEATNTVNQKVVKGEENFHSIKGVNITLTDHKEDWIELKIDFNADNHIDKKVIEELKEWCWKYRDRDMIYPNSRVDDNYDVEFTQFIQNNFRKQFLHLMNNHECIDIYADPWDFIMDVQLLR